MKHFNLLFVSLLSLTLQAQTLVVSDQLRAPRRASAQTISKVALANPSQAPLADGVDIEFTVTDCKVSYFAADNDWYITMTVDNGWKLYLDVVSSTFAGTYTLADCLTDYTYLLIAENSGYYLKQADIVITGDKDSYFSVSVRGTFTTDETFSASYVKAEEYDQKSDVQVSFTTADQVEYTLYDGFAYWLLQSADRNDVLALLCNTESGKGPKAGVFPINNTDANWTVQGGSVSDGSVSPSYYGLLNSDGYITNLWLVHSGTVTITDVDGDPKHMWIEVDAVNTLGNRVRISYNAQQTDNRISYTTTDGKALELPAGVFGDAQVTTHTYSDGKGVILFDRTLTTVGKRAFQSQQTLQTITLPAAITTIGQEAFAGCSALTGVSLPESVTSVGNYAFAVCANLRSVMIPASLTLNSTVFRYSPLVQVKK